MIKKFRIPGEPTGKGRPRFSTRGGFVKTYTPEKTASFENLAKLCYLDQCGAEKLEGEIRADVTAVFAVPQSFSKRKKAEALKGINHPTKKPDCDNIAKTILDALNGIAYEDDKAVVVLTVRKVYGEDPCTIVRLRNEEVEDPCL